MSTNQYALVVEAFEDATQDEISVFYLGVMTEEDAEKIAKQWSHDGRLDVRDQDGRRCSPFAWSIHVINPDTPLPYEERYPDREQPGTENVPVHTHDMLIRRIAALEAQVASLKIASGSPMVWGTER